MLGRLPLFDLVIMEWVLPGIWDKTVSDDKEEDTIRSWEEDTGWSAESGRELVEVTCGDPKFTVGCETSGDETSTDTENSDQYEQYQVWE